MSQIFCTKRYYQENRGYYTDGALSVQASRRTCAISAEVLDGGRRASGATKAMSPSSTNGARDRTNRLAEEIGKS